MVIAVNGWMNDPRGFGSSDGRVVDVAPVGGAVRQQHIWHELIHMYLAGYIVAGFVVAGVVRVAWLRGRATATTAPRWSSR